MAHSLPSSAKGTISIEYFPPKGVSSERALITGAHALKRFQPDYQTITFGAGGSAAEGTMEWATQLHNFTKIPTACHLAVCHFSKADLVKFAQELWEHGITRLVVLRGDAAEGDGLGDFSSVADAISVLIGLHPFDISVAAYPEIHPKAVSENHDLDVLIEKQKAGAARAITQYFFDNKSFYRFRDRAAAKGFDKPIVPGIIPITNFERIKGFSEKCGASIPAEFEALFAAAGSDKAEHTKVAREILERQVRDLAQNDVDAIHIYSLNRVDLTADAIRAFKAEFSDESEPQFIPAMVG